MMTESKSLDLTHKDLDLIEAALHTQQKILSVQSAAGGAGAKESLTDIKHLIKRLRNQTEITGTAPQQSWGDVARSLFC